ncbi:hypothetical protein [Candidatus Nitrospira salsa]
MSISADRFLDSAKKCCTNSRRLLNEAERLEFEEVPATRHYLSIIAQEESAKAFLLYLVGITVLPWTPFLRRAVRDHHCKQLVGLILDYLSPDTEEFLRRIDAWRERGQPPSLPNSVGDAINILRHEKIGKWESTNWWWTEEPDYDHTALNVAEGKRDREKQRSLYVELGQNGQVASTPDQITEGKANDEFERARRIEICVTTLTEKSSNSIWDYERVENCFQVLFSKSNGFIVSGEL